MLVPGVIFSSGRVDITAGAAQAADFVNQGFGFMNDGTLAVDTDAPAGSNFVKGFCVNSTGAVYGTTTTDPSDVFHEGIRRTIAGQIVYEAAAAAQYSSRNPTTAVNDAFAVA